MFLKSPRRPRRPWPSWTSRRSRRSTRSWRTSCPWARTSSPKQGVLADSCIAWESVPPDRASHALGSGSSARPSRPSTIIRAGACVVGRRRLRGRPALRPLPSHRTRRTRLRLGRSEIKAISSLRGAWRYRSFSMASGSFRCWRGAVGGCGLSAASGWWRLPPRVALLRGRSGVPRGVGLGPLFPSSSGPQLSAGSARLGC